MTTTDPRPRTSESGGDAELFEIDDFIGDDGEAGHKGLPRSLIGWLTTTDHKAIGVAYAVTALVFLAIGGALAGIIRAELAQPGEQFSTRRLYNQVFTIHGSVMVFLFAVPFGFALANYLVPLQIGAPDMAFPRLNALSYWLYLFGGVIMLAGYLTDGVPPPSAGRLPAAVRPGRLAGHRCRPVDRRRDPHRHVGHADRDQHHHHHHDDAGARHDHVPHADPVLEHVRDQLHGPGGVPGAVRRPGDAGGRPTVRHALLRPRCRGVADPVPAPVLVLRPPRGVHRGPAVLRGRHGDLPRVRPPVRSSGTRASCWRRSPSRRCRRRCGRTTCSSRAPSCCRSSPPRRTSSPYRPA